MTRRLGCPTRYDVAIHARCGAQTLVPPGALPVTSVLWERTLDATSTATVVLNLEQAQTECCQGLDAVEPGMAELSVYRDGQLAWQGPVSTTTGQPGGLTIEARDVSAYLARVVNTADVGMKSDTNQDLTALVRKAVVNNLNDRAFSCPTDYPCMVPSLHLENTGVKWTTARTTLWVAYVLDIVNKLTELGGEWYATGRTFVFRRERSDTDRPQAVLTAADLTGDVQIVRSWDDLAARVWATTSTDTTAGITVSEGQSCTPYGRADLLLTGITAPKVETAADRTALVKQLRAQRDKDIDAERAAANTKLKAVTANDKLTQKEKDAQRTQIQHDRDAKIDQLNREFTAAVDAHDTNVTREQNALTTAYLQQLARQALKGRYPVPASLRVTDGAALSPDAPVGIEQLMPGERFDVRVTDRCRPLVQSMRLTKLSVTWDTDNGEKAAVSFAPLAVPPPLPNGAARA
ncbi:hypothetical protein [Streptacidiphilus cavernicola]|uniref:Minor tail protein n=1 Tax=Streptacidiphilus cavernicola TaxID=3342716 RepID=A0ABV6VYB8_9ACTN